MPLPYSHTTLLQARTQLAVRLQDTGNVYWGAAELNLYIVEALRTYQALTGFYREKISWPSTPFQPFYDLTSDPAIQPLYAQQFGYSVYDTDILTAVEYHLLEPATVPYSGTNQFSQAQLANSIEGKRDQFLLDTGCVVTRAVLPFPAPPISRLVLPDSVIDIRRAAWVDSTANNLPTPLWRTDEFAAESFSPGWPQNPTTPPLTYSVSVTPPVTVQVIPPPGAPGQIDLVTLSSGTTLTSTGAPSVLLGIPDDFSPALKWGALEELLAADGQARDETRAKYAGEMYDLLVAAAKLNPSVLQVQINAVPIFAGSVQELDTYLPTWATPTPTPFSSSTFAGMAGRNLLAIGPLLSVICAIDVDLVRNMPVPAIDGDFLQVGREEVDDILDYAQHIATFKSGGQEFLDTVPLRDSFLNKVLLKNSRLRAAAFYKKSLESPAYKQTSDFPRLLEVQ